MAERKVILVIRRTLDWLLKRQKKYWFIDNNEPLKMWDRHLSYDWLSFRKSLNDIAFENMNELRADVICNYCYCETPVNVLNIPNSIIVPVDEDDWLSPELFKYLREVDINEPSINMLTWRGEVIRQFYGDNQIHTWQGEKIPIPSCCYALLQPTDKQPMWSHLEAGTRYLKEHTLFTTNIFSAWIQTVGSASFLCHNDEVNFLKAVNNIPNIDNVTPIFKSKWVKLRKLLEELKCSLKIQTG